MVHHPRTIVNHLLAVLVVVGAFYAVGTPGVALAYDRSDSTYNSTLDNCPNTTGDIWFNVDAGAFDTSSEYLKAFTWTLGSSAHLWEATLYDTDGTTVISTSTRTHEGSGVFRADVVQHTRPSGEGYKI